MLHEHDPLPGSEGDPLPGSEPLIEVKSAVVTFDEVDCVTPLVADRVIGRILGDASAGENATFGAEEEATGDAGVGATPAGWAAIGPGTELPPPPPAS